MQDEKPELRVLFSFETSSDNYSTIVRTLEITGRFVHYYPSDGRVRNISDYDERGLADLAISAYGSDDGNQPGTPWGWSVGFHSRYRVELADAEAMAKTLRKVERHLAKLRDQGDYPTAFHMYAREVAKCLGATSFGWQLSGRGWSHDDYQYRWGGASDLYYRVNDQYREMTRDTVSA